MTSKQTVTVTLIRGLSGRNQKQRSCVFGLGLRRINSTRTLRYTPQVAGMINKIKFMLRVTLGEQS